MDEVRKASSLLNASAFADCAQLNAMDSPEIFGEHKTNRTLALRARISFVFIPIYSKTSKNPGGDAAQLPIRIVG